MAKFLFFRILLEVLLLQKRLCLFSICGVWRVAEQLEANVKEEAAQEVLLCS